MKKIKIFALIEGNIIKNLSNQPSGTYVRIYYTLKYIKDKADISLIYIPYSYFCSKSYFALQINRLTAFIAWILSFFIIIVKKPDYIYLPYPHSIVSNRLNYRIVNFFKKKGIKLIVDVHDWLDQSRAISENKATIKPEIESELVGNADILFLGIENKYPKIKACIVPNGFDDKELKNIKYSIKKGRFNIGYVGAITKNRGIDILVDATSKIHQRYNFVKLFLYGEFGKIDSKTKEKILKLEYICQRQVPRTKLRDYIANIDVFMLPYDPNVSYLNKVFPTKLFEYIGSEVPIICTKCQSISKLLPKNSILFVDYNVEDFCNKLEYLLNNPKEREEFSKNLRSIKARHTWKCRSEKMYKAIIKSYIRANLTTYTSIEGVS
ncbi:MAG TPA: glycosyltransferase [Candidatus Atribacteria bacterium]|nr:glycosyltransferase [Candidatus Atribacteria bacterium]